MRSHKYMDWKTVVFILKISTEIGKVWFKSLTCAKGEKAREKKPTVSVSRQSRSLFSASFQTFTLTYARTWISKNTDCFAVYYKYESISTPHFYVYNAP